MYKNNRKNLKDLFKKITPLQRMINSDGLDDTFKLLKEKNPDLVIHQFKSGQKVEDWVVPKNWRVTKGLLKDKNKKILASINDDYLFVAPYSEPVKGWFTKSEISKHLMTREDKPNDYLLEHRNAYDYNLKSWGITLPNKLWKQLKDEKYYIEIDVEFKKQSMKVGEIFIKGNSKKTICLTAHIDELCNDDLSGCLAGIEFFKNLNKINNLEYSYQLLLFPELFGPIFYLNKIKHKLSNYYGMINLETVGAGKNLCLKKSLNENFFLEKIMRLALSNLKIKFKELNFFEGYLNDEKIFSWPTFNIPSIALQRYPFSQYHTSSDNLDLINYDYLIDIIKILEEFVYILENDYKPKYKNKFPPWLTKRGLYFDKKDRPDLNKNKFNNNLLYYINGVSKLSDICLLNKINFREANNYLDKFVEQKLIKKNK